MIRYPISKNFGLSIILLTCLAYSPFLLGQTNQTGAYMVFGSAVHESCNCFILTPEKTVQVGAVWSTNTIDLKRSFDLQFKVNLGCRTGTTGADGIAFVLQLADTGLGKGGKDLGFKGIIHSLGVTIDTYQNADYGDPSYDHLAFQANGDMNHTDLQNNLAGPVQALKNDSKIKDCSWHILEVEWDPADSTLSAYIDGVFRLSMQKDIIHRLFSGQSKVHWGLTGGTGGAFNEQQVCTIIQAGPYVDPAQKFCENAPIAFRDSSTNQVLMNHWYWNFGDGTGAHAEDPSHTYSKPGTYLITEAVEDAAGCADTNTTHIEIGSYPVAKFTTTSICSGLPITLTNQSSNKVGNISNWRWTLSNGAFSTDSIPNFGALPPGNYSLSLLTTTADNCTSLDPYDVSFSIYPKPEIGFQADTTCVGSTLILNARSTNAVPINQWYWQVDTLVLDSGQTFQHIFTEEKTFPGLLWAFSNMGCSSDTAQQTLQVQQSHAFAGNDTVGAKGYPIQLQATGGVTYRWFPVTYLSETDIPDPVAQPTDSITYTLTALSSAGCPSTATISIKVYRGPTFYVPSAFTPNGDGINDLLKVVAPGIRQFEFLKVYDRWGRLVYNSADLERGWDGTENGHPMPIGAYIWIAQGVDYQGNTLDQKGTTVLMR